MPSDLMQSGLSIRRAHVRQSFEPRPEFIARQFVSAGNFADRLYHAQREPDDNAEAIPPNGATGFADEGDDSVLVPV